MTCLRAAGHVVIMEASGTGVEVVGGGGCGLGVEAVGIDVLGLGAVEVEEDRGGAEGFSGGRKPSPGIADPFD